MFGFLKQSTATQIRTVGPFIDDTDFKTTETGLTIANTDVKLSKNGATGVNKNSGGGTALDNGMYSLTFDATDTDTVGEIEGSIAISGALLVCFKFFVLEESIYAALFGAGAAGFDTNMRMDLGSWLGTAVTTSATSAKPQVDMDSIDDSVAAATNLRASALTIVPFVVEGTPSVTVIQTDLAETTDDHYIGRVVIFADGAAAYSASDITDYTGTTGTITVTALATAPSSGDVGVII